MFVKNILAKRMSHKIMESRIVHNNPFVKAGRRTGARRVPARDLRGVIRRARPERRFGLKRRLIDRRT